MKILFFIAVIFGAWYLTDLDSESVWLCVIAPLLLFVCVVLSVAEIIREFGFGLGSEDGPGDGGSFD